MGKPVWSARLEEPRSKVTSIQRAGRSETITRGSSGVPATTRSSVSQGHRESPVHDNVREGYMRHDCVLALDPPKEAILGLRARNAPAATWPTWGGKEAPAPRAAPPERNDRKRRSLAARRRTACPGSRPPERPGDRVLAKFRGSRCLLSRGRPARAAAFQGRRRRRCPEQSHPRAHRSIRAPGRRGTVRGSSISPRTWPGSSSTVRWIDSPPAPSIWTATRFASTEWLWSSRKAS